MSTPTPNALEFDVELRAGSFQVRHHGCMAATGTLVLFGASGSGKSLTLRALAGLSTPAAGVIRQRGRTVFDAASGCNVPPQQRRVGYVPQHGGLFPHLSVRGNVGFGVPRATRTPRVDEILESLGLTALADRRPASLAGGEAQRVAVARALATAPDTLLLDEPFSALDRTARVELGVWFREHVRRLDLVVVLVTHDADEAGTLGDHVVIVDGGRTVTEGSAESVLPRRTYPT